MTSTDVLDFWFKTLTREDWFMGGERVDRMIIERFSELRLEALRGECDHWIQTAKGALALIIVLDQFSRNMFRGSGKSFECDEKARAIADNAISAGLDLQLEESERIFVYLPFMHSENIKDQDRCIALIAGRMPEKGIESHLHARAHREIIRIFDRFPYRNDALGRESSDEEVDWLENVGYRNFVETLRSKST